MLEARFVARRAPYSFVVQMLCWEAHQSKTSSPEAGQLQQSHCLLEEDKAGLMSERLGSPKAHVMIEMRQLMGPVEVQAKMVLGLPKPVVVGLVGVV